MSHLHNFFSDEGHSKQEIDLISAAHKIAGRDRLIREGRGLRLLPQLLPASSLYQEPEEGGLGANRLIQELCGGQSNIFSPGVLASNNVSALSPLLRAEQWFQRKWHEAL